ncbi:hypothetical protein JVU11DRAFT_8534 [Chiua virens]|nr:hypothetical protein JVU11DRAFT_8534 [Chiua virens]
MSFSRKTLSIRPNKSSPLSASSEFSTRSFVSEQRTRTLSQFGGRASSPSVLETRTEARTVIQKEEWLEGARRSTEHFKIHGSPLPLVWVLTEGNEIPDHAVPLGEDRNGYALYIARALLEGRLHIGTASSQFAGAIIGYGGKEHIIHNYEVLVCASQLRWGFPSSEQAAPVSQGTVVLAQQRTKTLFGSKLDVDQFNTTLVEADIPRFIPTRFEGGGDREAGLRRLAEIKTVIVIDDSISMQDGNLWMQAREALAGVVDIATQYGFKGVDIHFMHEDDFAPNMRSRAEVVSLFDRILPEGEDTPTGAKLSQIFNHYLPFIESERSTHEPINVVVITDGLPTDQDDLERVIVEAAHRLDRHRIKHDMFGIQFVQIGTDPGAAELLHALDDHLVSQYRIRDIVDSTPYDPAQGAFDTEYMLKILLGSLNRDLDRTGSALGQAQDEMRSQEKFAHGLGGRLGSNSPRLKPLSPKPLRLGY